ncbi:VCBS repeat-containing protein [Formosa sp. PL04]|uniref:VCBS repeat-containing protein n=1 Tax=Formosa sp. PL04 TaxID=3081755 RepID=UPI002981C31D|nr:VCBS repeat-containing protein [Formosa sp. PL04]MDW5288025.1 VCBS repeat-containing protein [Formosa sp. PL04]
MIQKNIFLLVGLVFLVSCQKEIKPVESKNFIALKTASSGIDFSNTITENDSLNYFNYTSIYSGGGVSVGDINNDGLIDIFFTGNMVQNKLYLNKGNLQFEDITEKANIGGDDRWYTGTTMADVNGDGFLDVYCSVSGMFDNTENQLFINNGDGTFTEKAQEYGVADSANSTQGTFFDYDNDGDLDLYVANYPKSNVNSSNFEYKNKMLRVTDAESDKLYRNDGDTFTNVSEIAGVKSYGFSYGVVTADINNDGWQDIYISSDYSIPDYFYINNQDGTFKEVVKEATAQTAFYGMGVDVSDFNNDGNLDIFQADMDANNNRRQKANMASMNPQLFWETVLSGFHYQYMHNCMQLNTGVYLKDIPQFSNISRLTGTSSTDWSWGPLFADFDNDGNKDLFITNGIRREVNNRDFFNTYSKNDGTNLSDLEKSLLIPSEKIDNFIFKNKGNLTFEKANEAWGIEHEGFSNGVAYADLDNDGDLEIITNNVDEVASVYENTNADNNNFITINFEGTSANKFGLGNRVYVTTEGQTQLQELTLSRGFQSSVAPQLHFGLNKAENIDELKVVWNDGKVEKLQNVAINQLLTLQQANAVAETTLEEKPNTLFETTENEELPVFKHVENVNDDFLTQVLMPHKMSQFGPVLAVGDLNNDGLDDFYVGGSFDHLGSLFFQTTTSFELQEMEAFKTDKYSEDIGALIFDADNDGDNDLYVVSGGYEFAPESDMLQDRLYLNNGKGQFTKAENALPVMKTSGSKVCHADFDNDGKQDVLVLGRQVPGKYPSPANTYLLLNKSSKNEVKFEDATEKLAKEFFNLGMATSAVITDYNNDERLDIIIVGEWMPIKVFKNTENGFQNTSEELGLTDATAGWWWSIKEGDFDNDGDMDYIVGNNGLNYKYQANDSETFDIYVNDFDQNNQSDIVLSYYNEGKQFPVRGRSCSSQQIPSIKSKFKNYDSFSEATLVDVYSKEKLENALHYQVKSFASIYLENKETEFVIHQLPIEAQLSSINQIVVEDFNNDEKLDFVIAGNLYVSEIETPRNDGGFGYYFEGNGNGTFNPIPPAKSGFYATGDVKDLGEIKIKNEDYIIAVKNDDFLQFIKVN